MPGTWANFLRSSWMIPSGSSGRCPAGLSRRNIVPLLVVAREPPLPTDDMKLSTLGSFHVDDQLTRVAGRNEVLVHHHEQQGRRQQARGEQAEHGTRVAHRPRQRTVVTVAHMVEPAIEPEHDARFLLVIRMLHETAA